MIKRTRFLSGACRVAAAICMVTPVLYCQVTAGDSFQNIQVLNDIPSDQLAITMQYFTAALGRPCSSCHETDKTTGVPNYATDTGEKKTARAMIKMVQSVNAGNFGVKISINCGTCHQGHSKPLGLQAATIMTADELALLTPHATVPAAAHPAAPGPAPATADDVLKKYTNALGAAAAGLQSRVMTGTLTNRTAQTMPFSISQKGKMYLETVQGPDPRTIGFDGSIGWEKTGGKVAVLSGFDLDSALRGADMQLAKDIKAKYPAVLFIPGTQLVLTPGSAPVDVNMLLGTAGQVTEQFYFDVSTGLLLRRVTRTGTPLNGDLTETTDYGDYRAEGGVMTAHKITRTNWDTHNVLTVSGMTVNGTLDDASFQTPK
jgi:Photosynthetic reaction centre cytochrome C subunit